MSFGLYMVAFDLANTVAARRYYPHEAILSDCMFVAAGLVLAYCMASISWFILGCPILSLKNASIARLARRDAALAA